MTHQSNLLRVIAGRFIKSACGALLLLTLTACDDGVGRAAMGAFVDTLKGEPDAAELARSEKFEGAGIRFEYPAVLRRRESSEEDGDRSWSFEYGLFELEMYAPMSEVRAADYLEMLGSFLEGGDSLDAEKIAPGRTETWCGHAITATKLRVKVMGDWSEYQAFDLPAPAGQARLLIFDDEPVNGQPSAAAKATWERVLASLECDAAFVPVATASAPGD
jgi:hypothetical protein